MKFITKKKLSIVCLISILVIGASAWLANSEISNFDSNIKTGVPKIEFTNELNTISLSGNEAIPMTTEYAIANLTPYTFQLANTGDIDLDYEVSIKDFTSTFPENMVMVVDQNEVVSTAANGTVLFTGSLHADEISDEYSLIPYLNNILILDDYSDKAASFTLIVNAVQKGGTLSINTYYDDIEKSLITAKIFDGETDHPVNVYKIKGDSKAELLAKLNESGLVSAEDIDEIVEVEGDDFDGINTTATFNMSSFAEPGEKIIILHYNEETEKWEYVGTSTVNQDGLVSADFTSYSPVVFVSMSPLPEDLVEWVAASAVSSYTTESHSFRYTSYDYDLWTKKDFTILQDAIINNESVVDDYLLSISNWAINHPENFHIAYNLTDVSDITSFKINGEELLSDTEIYIESSTQTPAEGQPITTYYPYFVMNNRGSYIVDGYNSIEFTVSGITIHDYIIYDNYNYIEEYVEAYKVGTVQEAGQDPQYKYRFVIYNPEVDFDANIIKSLIIDGQEIDLSASNITHNDNNAEIETNWVGYNINTLGNYSYTIVRESGNEATYLGPLGS